MEKGNGKTLVEQGRNKPSIRFPSFKDEWEQKRLGDIATFSKGKGISKADIIADGLTECIRYGELYTKYGDSISEVYSRTNSDLKHLVLSEKNDVIIPASGETQLDIAKASCVLKSGVALGGDLNIIRTKNDGVFLSLYLNNKKKIDIANLAQGISVIHLYSSQLATLNLNLPTLPEQKRIASFFTAVDKKIAELKQKKALLESYKKGVMQGLFANSSYESGMMNDELKDLDSLITHNSKFITPLRFKDENGKEFPKWEKKTLGEIAEKINSGKTPLGGESVYTTSGILFIRSQNIIDNKLSLHNSTFIPEEINSTMKNSIVKANDILLNITGASLGRSCVVPQNFEIGNVNQHVCIIRIDKHNEPRLIQAYFSTTEGQNIFNTLQTGSGREGLNFQSIRNISMYLPSFEEQTKIANFLSAIDEKINQTETQIQQTQEWKKGLLQQMFV